MLLLHSILKPVKEQQMARTTRKTRTTPKALTPVAALREFTNSARKVGVSARKALENGLQNTRRVALGKAAEARKAAIAGAEDARTRTMGAVTQLEKIFEQRVSHAMARMGVPTARDVRALSRQVAQLQASVERLKRARARA
jgi:poly(hydroxyalkanoate) granule-associated protein